MEKGAGLLAAGCWFPQQQGLAWLHCEEAPLGKVAGKEDRRWLFQSLPFSEVVVAVNTREPLVLEVGEGRGALGLHPSSGRECQERPVGSELIVYMWTPRLGGGAVRGGGPTFP